MYCAFSYCAYKPPLGPDLDYSTVLVNASLVTLEPILYIMLAVHFDMLFPMGCDESYVV